MEQMQPILEKIGLTGSEAKIYIALLKLGTSKKAEIIKESKISPSKLYDIADKLIAKGLISIITKNNIKYFTAANPQKINEYLKTKKQEIEKEEITLTRLMPELEKLQKFEKQETKIEVFIGWEGMSTAYSTILNQAKIGDKILIIGAGKGIDEKHFERFYIKYSKQGLKKKLNIQIIFDKDSRQYSENIEKNLKIYYNKRFLNETTPSEILIHKNTTAIILKKQEPIIIIINDKDTANSFSVYFNALWKNARTN